MILILGGTTEGRIAVKTFEEAGKPYYYSTKGDGQEVSLHNGIRLRGAMNALAMENFCRKQAIKLLVDAAHPFAEELHETVRFVANRLRIPVIRFERIFPERDEENIVWCENYEEAIYQLEKEEIFSLLALTGVQTIGKLMPLWKKKACCHFRILNRESSRELARQQGFPEKYLCYYQPGEDERILLQQLRPEAILIKESGISGGFCEKIQAAQELGIRVFAICRPQTPESFLMVNGEHGLRLMVEKQLPQFYPLHCGLTTGTCATAAAVAATWDVLNSASGPRPTEFPVILPNGETILVPVEPQTKLPHSSFLENGNGMFEAEATVIKNSGDDPDCTNGIKIIANVAVPFRLDEKNETTQLDDYNVIICGGDGVGIVTIPGLGIPLGESAINATPRKMIEKNVKQCLRSLKVPIEINPFIVTISVPGGEEIARRTFNPRLGIEGGISIIGTSGIVKPFSSKAFVNSIRKSMEVALATNSPRFVLSSGAKSEQYIKAYYPDLPGLAFVHYGNFIGETLKIAAELKLPRVSLGVMIGKAVKLAEGHLDTHSKKVGMNREFIGEIARKAGCTEEVISTIGKMTLARELWDIIPSEALKEFCKLLLEQCHRHCDSLLPQGELTILLITENGIIHT